MSTVESILKLLDKWPTWKRIKAAPDQIGALQDRIAALEQILERAPGEACPKCGQLAQRAVGEGDRKDPSPFGIMGIQIRDLKCENCGYTMSKQICGPHR